MKTRKNGSIEELDVYGMDLGVLKGIQKDNMYQDMIPEEESII